MNWNEEIVTSLIWLVKTFVISGIGFAAVFGAVLNFTQAGQDFLRLTGAYFSWRRNVKPLMVLSGVILLALIAVKMSVLLSIAMNGIYTALQEFDAPKFWLSLGIWSLIAIGFVIRYLVNTYVQNVLILDWRTWLTNNLLSRWLEKQTYYRSHFATNAIDNPDQRIQEDIDNFVRLTLTLSIGLLRSCVSLYEFTLILWALSGTLALFGIEIPRAMVILAYLYVVVATIVAVWLGRPLINLSFLNEKFSANFRYALIRLREYGEGIAFYRGEALEQQRLISRFNAVIANAWALVFRQLKFDGFNVSASQIAVVFPLIIQAPRVFSKEIKLGDMMQSAQAFNEVQDSLSFFREAYEKFANYRAVMIRLNGFLDVVEETEKLPRIDPSLTGSQFRLLHFTVSHPDNASLISELNLHLEQGDALLIQGPSGIGKTTLLRSFAGLWPYASGELTLPSGEVLFLPQKPYLPLGSLKDALFYPNTPSVQPLLPILDLVQLAYLEPRLEEEADWGRVLSLGEQQRLAIARALLMRPAVVFLDEASSAMDEGLEFTLYQMLRRELPEAILISVGHRSSLAQFHNHTLLLAAGGLWQLDAAVK